jgi:hypothetical protein
MVQRSTTQSAGPSVTSLTKTIPFDYVFEFKLKGKDPNSQDVVKLQDVVEISMQGVFVAASLGYSFVLDESKVPRGFPPVINQSTVSSVPLGVLIQPQGTGRSFELGGLLIAGKPNINATVLRMTDRCAKAVRQFDASKITFINADEAVPEGSTDLFPIAEDGNLVLEFGDSQVLPIGLNFRIWDRTNDLVSEPLPAANFAVGPDPVSKRMPVAGAEKVFIYGESASEVRVSLVSRTDGAQIPLTNSSGGTTFKLDPNTSWGPRIGIVEVNLSNSGVEVLNGGDLILIQETEPAGITHSIFPVPNPRLSNISLDSIAKGLATTGAGLSTRFRLSPRAAALLSADPPIGQVSRSILENAFEPAAGPEDISFLYSIDIVSSGRELQNKPIHNIAGLGIANGDRPFRPFARPIAFEPRSVIRIQIEELSTLPGTLYIVLQGYKTLGTGRRPE